MKMLFHPVKITTCLMSIRNLKYTNLFAKQLSTIYLLVQIFFIDHKVRKEKNDLYIKDENAVH